MQLCLSHYLVLLCFNLLAVNFIWQDWKFRQLSQVINRTMNTNCRYLDAILVQYYQGKDNGLSYRIAHRDAHNSDAELASVISNMSAEPKSDQTVQEKAFRLLCLNHTMLSYISALEAHRDKLDNKVILNILNDAVCYVDTALKPALIDDDRIKQIPVNIVKKIEQAPAERNSKEQLVLQQTGL